MRRGDWIRLSWLLGAIIILAVLFVYAEISERSGVARKEAELKAFYPEVKEENVGYIRLQKGTTETQLKRDGEQWFVKVAEERWFPATKEDVQGVLDYFIGLKPAEVITTDREKLGKFELTDEMALTATLAASEDAEEPLAVFKLGKTGPDYRSVYARVDDLSTTYLLAGNKNSVLSREPLLWRDKHPFHGRQEDITALKIEQGRSSFSLLKGSDGQWSFSEAGEAGEPKEVDQDKVVEFLARLSGLLAIRLRDEEEPKMKLGVPDFVITVTVSGEEVALSVSPETEESRRFVRNSALEQIYELAASTFVDFPLTREHFEKKEQPPQEVAAETAEGTSESAENGEGK